jgi:hypothetical protein
VPLAHYGVAIGAFESFSRDPQHHFGHWYHGHVALSTSGGTWQSALDVDAPQTVGVSYRVVDGLAVADLGPVASMVDGFHELPHTQSSGALDYLRSPALREAPAVRLMRRASGVAAARRTPPFPPGAADALMSRLRRGSPWISSNGDNALDALEPRLRSATRIYVFGQRFEAGSNGVHDVHMNQGDPAGSQWYASNGTWQDGAVACQTSGGRVAIWQVRFNTQSLVTDAEGHPA